MCVDVLEQIRFGVWTLCRQLNLDPNSYYTHHLLWLPPLYLLNGIATIIATDLSGGKFYPNVDFAFVVCHTYVSILLITTYRSLSARLLRFASSVSAPPTTKQSTSLQPPTSSVTVASHSPATAAPSPPLQPIIPISITVAAAPPVTAIHIPSSPTAGPTVPPSATSDAVLTPQTPPLLPLPGSGGHELSRSGSSDPALSATGKSTAANTDSKPGVITVKPRRVGVVMAGGALDTSYITESLATMRKFLYACVGLGLIISVVFGWNGVEATIDRDHIPVSSVHNPSMDDDYPINNAIGRWASVLFTWFMAYYSYQPLTGKTKFYCDSAVRVVTCTLIDRCRGAERSLSLDAGDRDRIGLGIVSPRHSNKLSPLPLSSQPQ